MWSCVLLLGRFIEQSCIVIGRSGWKRSWFNKLHGKKKTAVYLKIICAINDIDRVVICVVIHQIPFPSQRVGLGTRLMEIVVNTESRGCCIADGNRGIPGEGHDITFSVPNSRSAIHSFVPSESMALCGFQFWHVNLQVYTWLTLKLCPNSMCLPLGWAWKEYHPSNSTVWSSQQVQWSNRESECYVYPIISIQYPMVAVVIGVQDIQRVFCEEVWTH